MSDRPVAVDADETTHNENLPYPVVAYPSHYSTFIGFKRDPDDDLYFCSCAREAIENYLDCQYEYLQGSHREATPENLLNSDFPEDTKSIIHDAGINDVHNIVDALLFEGGLCHKCNAVVPSRRYCHEMLRHSISVELRMVRVSEVLLGRFAPRTAAGQLMRLSRTQSA